MALEDEIYDAKNLVNEVTGSPGAEQLSMVAILGFIEELENGDKDTLENAKGLLKQLKNLDSDLMFNTLNASIKAKEAQLESAPIKIQLPNWFKKLIGR